MKAQPRPLTCYVFRFLYGSSGRRLCLENQESQIRACERQLCQSCHPGWMVGFATRSEAEEAMRELRSGKWTCYPHDKADRSWVGRDRIRSQNMSGPVNNVEALLGAAGGRSAPRGGAVEADTSLVVIGFPKKYCHPERGRQPRPDRHQLPHTGSRSLEGSQWTSYHPDPEGSMVSKTTSRRKRGVRCLLSPLLCRRRRPRVQGCPTPSRIRPPGGSEESEGCRPFHPRGCFTGKGSRIAHEGVRLRECRWPGLLRGGIQEVYRGKMGGHKSGSVVEQSCCAGISGRLALHSRSILPCREDQECHHSVSGAASPPQTAARFWVFAYLARRTTQTSTSAGSWCGQNREKQQWKVKRLQNLGRVWSEETPRHQ